MKTAQDYLTDTASGHTRGGFNSRLQGERWSDTIYGAKGSIWAERNAGWQMADDMIKQGKIFSEVKTENGSVEFKCFPDGAAWCCVGADFINIQESDCAFGDTWQEAVDKYVESVQ